MFSAQSDADACTLHTRIANPAKASNLEDLQVKYDQWQLLAQEYQGKFDEADLSDKTLETALRGMIPKDLTETRLKSRRGLKLVDITNFVEDMLADNRDFKGRETGDIGSLDAVRNWGDGGKSGGQQLGAMERIREVEKEGFRAVVGWKRRRKGRRRK